MFRCSSTTSAHFGRTRFAIEQALKMHREHAVSGQLEIETYTWDVLPGELKTATSSITSREIEWVRDTLAAGSVTD